MKLRIGTRGSDLALWQARHVAGLLEAEAGIEVELVVLATRGDVIEDIPLQNVEGRAFFTAEIEQALLEGRVDLAVHSHKDLATAGPPELVVAAIPPRASPGERLLSSRSACDPAAAFLPLRPGARVGTSAPRRREQLRALRPDLTALDLRGNVPTRVRKLRAGAYDAIVLAAAGLDRLELDLADLIVTDLPAAFFVPAPAQGALAIQTRRDDARVLELCRRRLHDEATARCVEAERSLLVELGGGCNLPLGVLVEPPTIPSPHPPGGRRSQHPAGDGPLVQDFRAHAFFGADHPRPGLPARWVSANGPDAASAAARAGGLLSGDARGLGGPLAGLRVGLAGSGDGRGLGSELAQRLSNLGVHVEHERVIRFEDFDVGAALAERLAGLREGDGLVLTSRRAAGRLGGLRAPQGVLLATVGSATARALEAVGHTPDVIGSGGALELARALPLARGARVLFPCAEDARGELEEELLARGIAVERLPLYRTHAVDRPVLARDLDARIYMSPSAVRATLDGERSQGKSTLRIALGASTAAELERCGLAHVTLDAQIRPSALDLDESVVWRLATLHRDRAAARPIRAATP